MKSSLEEDFWYLWRISNKDLILEPEFKFHSNRRWRFDFVYYPIKLAIELEGSIWTYGRHNRPQGFINDCEKYNEAIFLGWTVLRLTRSMISKDYLLKIGNYIRNRI